MRKLPRDLLAVFVVTIMINAFILFPGLNQFALRIPLGFVFVGFAPGYLVTVILFPESRHLSHTFRENDYAETIGLDGLERLLLSVVFSLVIVMCIVLILDIIEWPIRLLTVLWLLDIFILGSLVIGVRRGHPIQGPRLYNPALGQWIKSLLTDMVPRGKWFRILLSILMIMIILVSLGGIQALFTPNPNNGYTEFYILTEDNGGNLSAANYQTDMALGESVLLVVGIRNNEYETINYTAIIEIQRTHNRSEAAPVIEKIELAEFQLELKHNKSRLIRRNISPEMAGNNLRLTFLLYKGSPPTNRTIDNSYRHVFLWINVTESEPPSTND